jgi:hypothetical protein
MHATTPRRYFPNIVSTWSIRNYANTERKVALLTSCNHVSHGNTIIFFLNFCTKLQKINETWTLVNTELSISKIYKLSILFHGQKSRTFSFLRFHVTTSIHVTMAAQCPMFIIRRAAYFQYSMLYINLGIFVEIGSRSSGSIVTH